MADELDETPAAAADHVGDGKPGAAGKPPAPGGRKKDHKQAIIVVASTVGVVIAWMTYRSMKAGSSGQGATPGAATSPYLTSAAGMQAAGGNVAGYGDPSASAGFNSLMQNMQAEIEALNALITPSGTTTPVGTTPTPIITNPPPTGGTHATRGPATKPTFTFKAGLKYLRDKSTGRIYQVETSGQTVWLSPQQWAEAQTVGGKINGTYYSKPPAKTPAKK